MRAPRRAALTDAERADWEGYAKLVRPLPGRAPIPPLAVAPAAPIVGTPVQDSPAARAATARPSAARPAAALVVGSAPPGLDRASWMRFRGGTLAAERVLDLHGRTAERAFHALGRFLREAHHDGIRCVEIITGRGREGMGVIRRELPLWLDQPPLRAMVLAAAHPHPANPGSVRLLLRRGR